MTRYYVADTETTGAKEHDTVCEVGFIEIDGDFNILSEHESLIDCEQPISPSASGIHGLTYEDVQDSPTLGEYFSVQDPSCYGRKIEGEAIIIGHRIGFDRRFLEPYFENLVGEIDTLRWARKLWPDSEDHKLSTLKYALGLPRVGVSHRVMSDVMDAYHLAKLVCECTGMSLTQLAEASRAPMMVKICSFGKHKGSNFVDIPKSYLGWMHREMKDLDMDVLFTVETLLNKNNNKNEPTRESTNQA
jgi:DNA polymerase III epsilon subunit-like protein